MSRTMMNSEPKIVRSVSVNKESYTSNRIFFADFCGTTHSAFYSVISDTLYSIRDIEKEKELEDASQSERLLYRLQVYRNLLKELEKKLI